MGFRMILNRKRQKSELPSALILVAALLSVVMPADLTHMAAAGSWYFAAAEIAIAYSYQEQFGQRLLRPIKPAVCNYGKDEFPASYQGNEFLAPCRFIIQTKQHLKVMVERGAARYFFPLDADHAHLAIPKELWETNYPNVPTHQILPQILRESRLVALYHTAEHLAIADPKTGEELSQSKDWRDKRNVLGFFDGRPLKILPPNSDGSAHQHLEQYENVGTFYFLAHRLGEIVLSVEGKAIPFDMSFDEDSVALGP